MCGIFGGIGAHFDEQALARLRHRGPDQASLVRENLPGGAVLTLGQTRLNVVVREDIELPVRIGQAAILHNGEIYNHLELRAELEGLGWSFRTKTDTEVALAAYLQWGTESLERLNGMFALAIWDGEKLVLARDRMGEKPLFYRSLPGRFELASEIKALGELEFVSQDVFDLFEFCFDQYTLYRDVLSLPPGHYLVYDPGRGTCDVRSYWDIEHRVEGKIADERQAVERFIELLEDSVRLRMRADVPISMFLSGGIDSALVARLSGVREAFTCQFEELRDSIDEQSYAADLAARLGIELHVVTPTRDEFLERLPQLGYHLEMPTGSFSVFPLFCLAERARGHGYKVVLSGEGSDELFAGYARSEFLLGEELDVSSPKRRPYAAMLRRYHGDGLDRFCRMASRSGLGGAALMKMFLGRSWSPRKSLLDNVCYVESRLFLQPLLQMGDRMAMAHGVENRCPFLDHRLVELAFSLADSLRLRDGVGKWIVHEAARRLLPAGARVLSRPVKHGLATPVNLWLTGRHGFDRKYWNAVLTAECMRSLLGPQALQASARGGGG
ncbi:MAG: asparagine synthase (glutamine-hydrolyzing) [Deltaproteobacteria bacterium]|nr:asparagine synthase (glutamine-hydrolyzing) [Deltaproteobacteria bacterium]